MLQAFQLLVIWTDCDREGEAIGAEIVAICRQTKPTLDVYRARFSEITSTAVHRALNNLTRMDPKLVDAVECRSELDLRIGAAFTRLQTLHLRNNFATIFRDKSIIFLDCCEEAGGNARVLSVIKKPKNRWRPVALDTVELEKLAVRKLKLSAKEAMAVAERLYNKGYISYPRTETNKFPNDIDLSTYVQQQLVSTEWGEFAQEVASRGPNPRNGTQTDEAHPPIHPLKYAGPNELVGLEWLLYEFVVRHFLACLSTDAKGQETKVHVSSINLILRTDNIIGKLCMAVLIETGKCNFVLLKTV
ncbi:unnamed protein product [Gongylonema pulchrum]|uniref:DNA topoisomerase n=1 Tax=Gongylonema pulchrum TaxID=637853 RepID=A0A183EIX1_9BILA|nr:unnamed protein product [Gongylonema pulchrum]